MADREARASKGKAFGAGDAVEVCPFHEKPYDTDLYDLDGAAGTVHSFVGPGVALVWIPRGPRRGRHKIPLRALKPIAKE